MRPIRKRFLTHARRINATNRTKPPITSLRSLEYFYLTNDYSSNQAESIAQAACHYTSNVNSAADINSIIPQHRQAPFAINAWSQCNALKADFDPTVAFPDDGRRTVVVSFRYQGHDTSRVTSVTADGTVKCNGDLGPVTDQTTESFRPVVLRPNDTLTETCVRPNLHRSLAKRIHRANGYMYALPVDVVFSTPNGPVTAALQGLPVTPESTSSNIPIGGIIDWFTTAAEPTPPAGFMICDGSQINVGPLRGQSAPNLVHRFTMGVKSVGDGYFAKPNDPKTIAHDATTGIPAASWTVTATAESQQPNKSQSGTGACYGSGSTDCNSPQGHTHDVVIEDPPFVGLLKIIRVR